MGAIDFPDVAFNAVAHDGSTDFARNNVTNLASLPVRPDRVTYKRSAYPFLPFAKRAEIVFFTGKPSFSRQSKPARHNRLIFSRLCGKAFTALTTTIADYLASADRGHASPKTMGPFPLDIGRLKSPFHN